jgi:hypothetical protein
MAAFVAIAVAASAGCGGDGESAAKGTRAKRAIQTEAQARAESMVLELSDFPEGWRASAPDKDAAAEDRFRDCLGSDYSALTLIGDAESKDFAKEEATISSDATVFASEEQAEEAGKEISDGMEGKGAEDCFRDVVEKSIKQESPETEIDEVDVGELSFAAPGDIAEARAWQIAVSFHVKSGAAKGLTPTAYIDFVVLREGDSLASLRSSDVLSPFDSELRDMLLRAVASRMAQPGSS